MKYRLEDWASDVSETDISPDDPIKIEISAIYLTPTESNSEVLLVIEYANSKAKPNIPT